VLRRNDKLFPSSIRLRRAFPRGSPLDRIVIGRVTGTIVKQSDCLKKRVGSACESEVRKWATPETGSRWPLTTRFGDDEEMDCCARWHCTYSHKLAWVGETNPAGNGSSKGVRLGSATFRWVRWRTAAQESPSGSRI